MLKQVQLGVALSKLYKEKKEAKRRIKAKWKKLETIVQDQALLEQLVLRNKSMKQAHRKDQKVMLPFLVCKLSHQNNDCNQISFDGRKTIRMSSTEPISVMGDVQVMKSIFGTLMDSPFPMHDSN